MLFLVTYLGSAFESLFMLQMGHAYRARFEDFAVARDKLGLEVVEQWRKEQQDEWDRLSTTVIVFRKLKVMSD
jgi:hypothetical protein